MDILYNRQRGNEAVLGTGDILRTIKSMAQVEHLRSCVRQTWTSFRSCRDGQYEEWRWLVRSRILDHDADILYTFNEYNIDSGKHFACKNDTWFVLWDELRKEEIKGIMQLRRLTDSCVKIHALISRRCNEGTGTALVACGRDMCKVLTVSYLHVGAHPIAIGFYDKMGFDRVPNNGYFPDGCRHAPSENIMRLHV